MECRDPGTGCLLRRAKFCQIGKICLRFVAEPTDKQFFRQENKALAGCAATADARQLRSSRRMSEAASIPHLPTGRGLNGQELLHPEARVARICGGERPIYMGAAHNLRNPSATGQREFASQGPAHSGELATSMSPVATPVLEAVHKIDAIRYIPPDFKSAKELRVAFEQAHRAAKLSALEANDLNAEVVIALAKVQAILSERGEKYQKMRQDAGIGHWTWTSYFLWFKREFNYNRTLRTVQRKIAELEGKRVCTECKRANGHMRSCAKYKEPKTKYRSQVECRLLVVAEAVHNVEIARKQGGNVDQAIEKLIKKTPPLEGIEKYFHSQATPKMFIPEQHTTNLKPNEIEELAIKLAEHVIKRSFESALMIAIDILKKAGSNIIDAKPDTRVRVP